MGERIAALRRQLGWTQAELGRRIHVSSSTIGMYERGCRRPTMDILGALAKELGVSIDYLVLGQSAVTDPMHLLHPYDEVLTRLSAISQAEETNFAEVIRLLQTLIQDMQNADRAR